MAAADEDKDDLLAELDEMESEAVGAEMDDLFVNAGPISAAAAANPQPAAAVHQPEE